MTYYLLNLLLYLTHLIKLHSKQLTSNSVAIVEIAYLQKEFLIYQLKIENRLKPLEKTFCKLKSRKIMQEVSLLYLFHSIYRILIQNKDLWNIVNSISSLTSPALEPEVTEQVAIGHIKFCRLACIGVNITNFQFEFDKHTHFVREIFRVALYVSNSNAVLGDEDEVTELKSKYLLIGK